MIHLHNSSLKTFYNKTLISFFRNKKTLEVSIGHASELLFRLLATFTASKNFELYGSLIEQFSIATILASALTFAGFIQ